jgi:hypothetical protein
VEAVLRVVKDRGVDFDLDLDSVDSAATYEFYVERSGSAGE